MNAKADKVAGASARAPVREAKSAAGATWPEARAARDRGSAPVLAFGALEQHGPHLPLSTDTIMANWLAAKVAAAVDGWLLPSLPLGYTSGNDGFPGTVSLSFDTVRALASDVGNSLRRSGFRCLVIVNGDWGNQAPLHQAARDLTENHSWPVLVIDYPGLAEVASQVCSTPAAGPGFYHADEVETSVLLALQPDLVHMDRAVPCYPDMPATRGATPLDLARLSPTGVFGDPRPASAEKGVAILEALARSSIALASSFLEVTVQSGAGQSGAGQLGAGQLGAGEHAPQ